jgi:hypothetical protein
LFACWQINLASVQYVLVAVVFVEVYTVPNCLLSTYESILKYCLCLHSINLFYFFSHCCKFYITFLGNYALDYFLMLLWVLSNLPPFRSKWLQFIKPILTKWVMLFLSGLRQQWISNIHFSARSKIFISLVWRWQLFLIFWCWQFKSMFPVSLLHGYGISSLLLIKRTKKKVWVQLK